MNRLIPDPQRTQPLGGFEAQWTPATQFGGKGRSLLPRVLAAMLGATLMLCGCAPSRDIVPAAKGFVESLGKDDFTSAAQQFSPEMKAALPGDKLRETWQAVTAETGPFRAVATTRQTTQMGYQVVFVTTQFEKKTLDVKVVFDRQGRVSGLWFAPSEAATSSAAQAEAPPVSVRESAMVIGSESWALPGTLALPATNGTYRAVLLVHGSGPNDRDETVGANKPFRDLAWGLASRGIAVLRYEKRTKAHAAQCAASLANLTVKEEVLDDALTAVSRLRETDGIDPNHVFVLGHSLGGMLAPRIGALETNLAGLIILAGATRPLEDLVMEQTAYLLSLDGSPSAEGQKQLDALRKQVAAVKSLRPSSASSSQVLLGAPAKYWLDLRAYNPVKTAEGLTLPLLILQGGRDYQVTRADYEGWAKALATHTNVTLKLYPQLNHLFITGEGKSAPAEYGHAGHVAEEVVEDIARWIRGQR